MGAGETLLKQSPCRTQHARKGGAKVVLHRGVGEGCFVGRDHSRRGEAARSPAAARQELKVRRQTVQPRQAHLFVPHSYGGGLKGRRFQKPPFEGRSLRVWPSLSLSLSLSISCLESGRFPLRAPCPSARRSAPAPPRAPPARRPPPPPPKRRTQSRRWARGAPRGGLGGCGPRRCRRANRRKADRRVARG